MSAGEVFVTAAMSRPDFSPTSHAVAGMPLRSFLGELRLQHDKAFHHRFGTAPQDFQRRHAPIRRKP